MEIVVFDNIAELVIVLFELSSPTRDEVLAGELLLVLEVCPVGLGLDTLVVVASTNLPRYVFVASCDAVAEKVSLSYPVQVRVAPGYHSGVLIPRKDHVAPMLKGVSDCVNVTCQPDEVADAYGSIRIRRIK